MVERKKYGQAGAPETVPVLQALTLAAPAPKAAGAQRFSWSRSSSSERRRDGAHPSPTALLLPFMPSRSEGEDRGRYLLDSERLSQLLTCPSRCSRAFARSRSFRVRRTRGARAVAKARRSRLQCRGESATPPPHEGARLSRYRSFARNGGLRRQRRGEGVKSLSRGLLGEAVPRALAREGGCARAPGSRLEAGVASRRVVSRRRRAATHAGDSLPDIGVSSGVWSENRGPDGRVTEKARSSTSGEGYRDVRLSMIRIRQAHASILTPIRK